MISVFSFLYDLRDILFLERKLTTAKIIKYFRVYKIYESKMCVNNSTEAGREEMEVYTCRVLICKVLSLKIDWDRLNMYTINPKASLK